MAMKKAASEAYEGRHEAEVLAAMVDKQAILSQAMQLLDREQ